MAEKDSSANSASKASTTTKSTTKASDATDSTADQTTAKSTESGKSFTETAKSFSQRMIDFSYAHPFISMIILYIILATLVSIWSWVTIIFLSIPLVAAVRVYFLTQNVGTAIDGEDHKKLFWWARLGMYSSIAGMISVLILDFFNILNVF